MKSFLDILEKIIFFPWNITKSLLQWIGKQPSRVTSSISHRPMLSLIVRILLWVVIIFTLILTLAVYKSIIISGEIAVAAENSVINSAERLLTYGQSGIVSAESFAQRVVDNIVGILTSTSQSIQQTIHTTISLGEKTVSEFIGIGTGIFNKTLEIFQKADTSVFEKLSEYGYLVLNTYKDLFLWVINLNLAILKWFLGIGEQVVILFGQGIRDIIATVKHFFG